MGFGPDATFPLFVAFDKAARSGSDRRSPGRRTICSVLGNDLFGTVTFLQQPKG